MSMRRTSIDAYNQIKANGLLTHRSWQVYSMLYHQGPLTQNECWKKICRDYPEESISKQSINPRFAELQRKGVVAHVVKGKRVCSISGIVCMTWDATDGLPQQGDKEPSLKEKYAAALRYIMDLETRLKVLAPDSTQTTFVFAK